ncbi:MAG: S-methyl-5-thioribose-1-phosphate isomerase [Myxococcales bacterium]|nr:S-methyl-5-thioribose-1-phosphate isomerase [Myxococcales bacterium]
MSIETQIKAVTCTQGPEGRLSIGLIDQRLLPAQEVWLHLTDPEQVAQAITDMIVRGAPAIGVTAAYGLAQAMDLSEQAGQPLRSVWPSWRERFASTRPTAVNLFWAIDRIEGLVSSGATASEIFVEAQLIHAEDQAACQAMGLHGAPLLPQGGGVLHHCNTGALATGGIGTALGVLRAAVATGKEIHVWVDETRPYLQGSRLTAWECRQDNIPATLITDNMAGWLMQQGKIQAAIVGSDRIAANGDVANKIGTYAVAVLCKHHGIPMYVAAPTSTIDLDCASGAEIPIEERTEREVTHIGGWAPAELLTPLQVAPIDIDVTNPAFDVTPAELVSAIITEQGVARHPYREQLAQMVAASAKQTQGKS